MSLVPCCRAGTALGLTFHVPEEAQGHLEVLPKHGMVQGGSKFTAQLKLLPKRSIFSDCGNYVDLSSGVLEIPVRVSIANQVLACATPPANWSLVCVAVGPANQFLCGV